MNQWFGYPRSSVKSKDPSESLKTIGGICIFISVIVLIAGIALVAKKAPSVPTSPDDLIRYFIELSEYRSDVRAGEVAAYIVAPIFFFVGSGFYITAKNIRYRNSMIERGVYLLEQINGEKSSSDNSDEA